MDFVDLELIEIDGQQLFHFSSFRESLNGTYTNWGASRHKYRGVYDEYVMEEDLYVGNGACDGSK